MPIPGDRNRVITRRTLLRTGGTLAAGVVLAGVPVRTAASCVPVPGHPFQLGVASTGSL